MPSADNCEMLLQDLQEDLGILQNGSPGWESGVLILGSLAVIYIANYVLLYDKLPCFIIYHDQTSC